MGCGCSGQSRKKNPVISLFKMKNMNQLVDLWPPSYLEMLKQKFKGRAGSGGLDYAGFRALFTKIKSQKLAQHIFTCFDLDQNGKLDFREFCLMLSFMFNSDHEDRQAMLFHFFDMNQDQILDKKEFHQLVEQCEQFIEKDQQVATYRLDDFKIWVENHFNIVKYFETFELLPGPLKEREHIREILSQKDHKKYYVISYKWWELWKFYINYHFSQKHKTDKSNPMIDVQMLQSVAQELKQDEQGIQGSIYTDPQNPKCEILHGLNDDQDDLLPIEEVQNLRPGQIDNSDLQGEFSGELRQNILNNHDYIIVPQDAWDSLVQWYGCSGQIYKRKTFHDPKRKNMIVDLYPPLMKGYITNGTGTLLYKKSVQIQISSRKQVRDCHSKLAKKFKVNGTQYNFFYKKINDEWLMGNDDETLFDLQITSGTFVCLVKKGKLPNSTNINYKMLQLGRLFDVQHPQTNEWLLCHICDFSEDQLQVRFHVQRESFTREFWLSVNESTTRLQPPNSKSIQQQANMMPMCQPGVMNMGNTCFINTIVQCLVNTPLFEEYLLKATYKPDLIKQKPPFIIDELAKLACKLKDAKFSITPTDLKKTIDQHVPQFSGYEQHDAQEFLNIILDMMSDEVKLKRQPQDDLLFESVVKEMFMGKTINTLTCQQCKQVSQKVEDYFTLSLPIPLQEELNIIVILFKKSIKNSTPALRRYGVKIPKYGTLKDLYVQFEKVSGVQRFEFAEIYRHQIHKFFAKFDQKIAVRQLFKNSQILYAYEIHRSQKEIEDECLELMAMTVPKKEPVEKDFIDVEDKQGEWRHAQIIHIVDAKNQERTIRVQIQYPQNKVHLQFVNSYQMAPFRSKVQYKINITLSYVIQRLYSLSTDTCERFATPFVLVVPLQLTWKEFRVLVYNQAKRFIDFDYIRKKRLQQKQVKQDRELYSYSRDNEILKKFNAQSVFLGNVIEDNKYKRKTEQDLEEFLTRQRGNSQNDISEDLGFLSEPDFPYRLRLLDQNNYYCIQCDRPTSFKPTNNYCTGCELELVDAPLNYNPNTVISLDWIDSLAFNPLSTMPDNDDSYLQFLNDKLQRKDRIVPEQCFSLLTQEEKVEINCDKCNSKQLALCKFSLDHTPNILILHLKRFLYRDGYLEKIENDINFPFKGLNLKQWSHIPRDRIYDLYAVANHFGNGQNGHYTAYVLRGKDWIHCDDDQVRTVSSDKVLSQYAYLLFYRKREFPTSSILNLTYKY